MSVVMHHFTDFFAQKWKLIVNIVTLIALAIFIYAIRDQLIETWQAIDQVKWWFLLLIIPFQLWNYDAQTRLYRSLFRIVGNKFSYRQMFETSLELNFVNNVFPSGGVSGISYYGARMRSENVTAGRATLVQLMKLMLLFLSFEVMLLLGLFFLAAEGKVNILLLMIAVMIATGLLFGTALMAYVLSGKRRVSAFHVLLRGAANNLMLLLTGKRHNYQFTRVEFVLLELHHNYLLIRQNYRQLKKPFLWALLANLSEILTIYAVYAAFSQWVNPGAVILAYSVANFAGTISVLPGGVGIYEALMTTVLVVAGVPLAVSLPVTIMYRVLSTAIQVPPGYYFYHRTIHSGKRVLPENG